MKNATAVHYESIRDLSYTRQILLDAGARVFAEKGLAGTRVDDLVTASGGVNRSMIYYIFGSKHGLYQAVLKDLMEQIQKPILEIVLPELARSEEVGGNDAADGGYLRSVIFTLFDMAVKNPHWSKLFLRETLDGAADLGVALASIPNFDLGRKTLLTLLERGRQQNVLRIEDPHSFLLLVQIITFFPPVATPIMNALVPKSEQDAAVLSPENWKQFIAQLISLYMTPREE